MRWYPSVPEMVTLMAIFKGTKHGSDKPFTKEGLRPDLILKPKANLSRMLLCYKICFISLYCQNVEVKPFDSVVISRIIPFISWTVRYEIKVLKGNFTSSGQSTYVHVYLISIASMHIYVCHSLSLSFKFLYIVPL